MFKRTAFDLKLFKKINTERKVFSGNEFFGYEVYQKTLTDYIQFKTLRKKTTTASLWRFGLSTAT